MKICAFLLFLSIAGCAGSVKKSVLETEALKAASEPPPSCGPVNSNALATGIVTVTPGDVVCFKLTRKGASLVPTDIVANTSEDTVLVKVWSDQKNTFLFIQNPFDLRLKYKAVMLRTAQSEPEPTTTCSVLSKRFGFEEWPYLVRAFGLLNFSTEPESETVECRQ